MRFLLNDRLQGRSHHATSHVLNLAHVTETHNDILKVCFGTENSWHNYYSRGGLEVKRNCMASVADDEGLKDSLSVLKDCT
jgi:hypothetical protein